jgi:gamma-glutamyltranspeptidase/glutathione hydrolase
MPSDPGIGHDSSRTTVGYKTIGIPGTPAGMGMAHAKYGKLKWEECLEPARRNACSKSVFRMASTTRST